MTTENNQQDFDACKEQISKFETPCNENDASTSDCEEMTEIEILKQELDAAKLEVAENYDRFVRISAEFENFRRRMEKEKSESIKYGSERIFREMLPVLDSFEQALASNTDVENENMQNFIKGMQLVWKQMVESMERNGLKAIIAKDAPFDPNFHQAIQKIECEETKEEVVGDEYAKGYLFHDRLLRPSMVSVKVPK